jgi:Protein of unknown function (DUF1579)
MQHRARDAHRAGSRPSNRFLTGPPSPWRGTLLARRLRGVARAALAAMMLVSAVRAAALAPPPSPPPPRHDAQERYEPRSAPGAGQALLAKFAGDWNVVKTFYPMQGEPVRTQGECRQRMVHDGHFLESSFTFFDKDGGKTTGTGISGWDPKAGQFTTVWFDSRQTTMSMRQSQGTFDGQEIVLYGAALGGTLSRRSITRTHLEDDGRVLVHRHYLVQDDGKERLMMELRLTRRGPAAPAPARP